VAVVGGKTDSELQRGMDAPANTCQRNFKKVREKKDLRGKSLHHQDLAKGKDGREGIVIPKVLAMILLTQGQKRGDCEHQQARGKEDEEIRKENVEAHQP